MIIVCSHPITTTLTNKSKHFLSRLVYASSVAKYYKTTYITSYLLRSVVFNGGSLVNYCFFFHLLFFFWHFFSKMIWPISINFSDFTLNTIYKKIIVQFLGRHLWSWDISDFMYCLFTAFLKKYKPKDRTFKFLANIEFISAVPYPNVCCYFRSSSDGTKNPCFFNCFIY